MLRLRDGKHEAISHYHGNNNYTPISFMPSSGFGWWMTISGHEQIPITRLCPNSQWSFFVKSVTWIQQLTYHSDQINLSRRLRSLRRLLYTLISYGIRCRLDHRHNIFKIMDRRKFHSIQENIDGRRQDWRFRNPYSNSRSAQLSLNNQQVSLDLKELI